MTSNIRIEYWSVDKLIPYARNPRKNDNHVDRMAGAIREFGFKIPILAKSDGTVIDGHLRLKAANRLGLEQIPVVVADDLSEAQVKAFRLLANKSVGWAEWDSDLLKVELEELQDMSCDLSLTGFSESELASIFGDVVDDPNSEWQGMPEFEQEDKMPYRQIIVSFLTETDVIEFGKLLKQELTGKTKSVWFPKIERNKAETQYFEDYGKAST